MTENGALQCGAMVGFFRSDRAPGLGSCGSSPHVVVRKPSWRHARSFRRSPRFQPGTLPCSGELRHRAQPLPQRPGPASSPCSALATAGPSGRASTSHGPAAETRKWHKMVIDGWNLFAAASAGGNLTVMRWLAEAVAPLGWLGRICASHGVTEARNEIENVMLVACFNGHLEIVKYSPPRALPTSSWACLALAIANWQRRALVARQISMLPCG